MSIVTILIVVLICMLIFSVPGWGYHNYGYGPSGIVGLILVVILILFLLGRI